jgi:hypothetical protein
VGGAGVEQRLRWLQLGFEKFSIGSDMEYCNDLLFKIIYNLSAELLMQLLKPHPSF